MIQNSMSVVLSIVIVTIFSACGGGGGSSATNTSQSGTKTTTTGIIVDAQIYGLSYESVGLNGEKTHGLTNLKGEYEYFEGGTTTFFVGGIEVAQATPKKMLSITNLVDTPTEQENLARFLQTLDGDNNPENGIQIGATAINATDIKELKFDDTFDANFDILKNDLLGSKADTTSLVSATAASEHASKSERLSSLQEMDLYKAIANEKNYTSEYYNTDVLENDQRKRVYLWIWEKVLAKEMAIENDLATQEFDIAKVEEERDRYKKYLDYADSIVSLSSLGKGAYGQLAKAGTRTMSYELTNLTSLTISGCDAVVKLTNADSSDSIELADDDLCKNMMKVLNPVGDSTSKLAVANPILSGFLPEALPIIMRYKQMNWLHFDTKTLRALGKVNVSKPNLIALGISMASIVNDSAGAYRASNINNELTTRLVAQEWLSIWFRSGFKQEYINKLINNNSTELVGNQAQIEAIALNYGTSGAYCEALQFFNPFVDCSGIENINYDYQKVADIINEKLTKSNALYRNIGELTGSFSDSEANIGVIDISWKADENLTDVGESIKIGGKLIVTDYDGENYTSSNDFNEIKVRFSQCGVADGGGGYFKFGVDNYTGKMQSDGKFSVDLNAYDFDEAEAEACRGRYGVYGFQFYIDVNKNGTLDNEDQEVGTYFTDEPQDSNLSVTHVTIKDTKVSISDYTMKGDEFIAIAGLFEGMMSSEFFQVEKLKDDSFTADYYIDTYSKYTRDGILHYEAWNMNYFIFSSQESEVYNYQASRVVSEKSYTATTDDIKNLPFLTKSTE